MKIRSIIRAIGLSVAIFTSCQKEESLTVEPSDIVKGYFGFKKAAKKVTEQSQSVTGSPSTKLGTIKNMQDDECEVINQTENGKIITYLPCSGMEGAFSSMSYFGGSVMIIDICYIDFGKCDYFKLESGELDKNIGFFKIENHVIYEDGLEFKCLFNEVYQNTEPPESITYFNDVEISRGSGLRKGTILESTEHLSKGNISYNITLLEPIKLKFRETTTITENYQYMKPNGNGNIEVGTLRVEGNEGLEVQGIERVEYNRNGVRGEFIINYGNGELDTKAIIIEKEKSYEIDYVELWESIKAEFRE